MITLRMYSLLRLNGFNLEKFNRCFKQLIKYCPQEIVDLY